MTLKTAGPKADPEGSITGRMIDNTVWACSGKPAICFWISVCIKLGCNVSYDFRSEVW